MLISGTGYILMPLKREGAEEFSHRKRVRSTETSFDPSIKITIDADENVTSISAEGLSVDQTRRLSEVLPDQLIDHNIRYRLIDCEVDKQLMCSPNDLTSKQFEQIFPEMPVMQVINVLNSYLTRETELAIYDQLSEATKDACIDAVNLNNISKVTLMIKCHKLIEKEHEYISILQSMTKIQISKLLDLNGDRESIASIIKGLTIYQIIPVITSISKASSQKFIDIIQSMSNIQIKGLLSIKWTSSSVVKILSNLSLDQMNAFIECCKTEASLDLILNSLTMVQLNGIDESNFNKFKVMKKASGEIWFLNNSEGLWTKDDREPPKSIFMSELSLNQLYLFLKKFNGSFDKTFDTNVKESQQGTIRSLHMRDIEKGYDEDNDKSRTLIKVAILELMEERKRRGEEVFHDYLS